MAPAFAAPVINSFSPSGGPVGTSVVINGSGYVNITSVEFNGTPASFTRISVAQIRAVVPAGATSGKIRVTASSGTVESAGIFAISAGITSFTPTIGGVGTNVVITGSNLNATTQVAFNGTAATVFTIVSNERIDAVVPIGATTGPISVTSAAGTVASSTVFRVIPTITGFTPISGPVGTSVVISGYNFTGAIIVRFNFVSTTYVVNDDNTITAPVPVGAQAGPIMVTTMTGTGASTFSFFPTSDTNDGLPVVTTVTAAQVGAQTTITGKNFGGTYQNARPTDVEVTFTKFGGGTILTTPDTSTTNSANGTATLKVTVPDGATHGPVTVTTPMGTTASPTDFILTPKITSYTPAFAAEGEVITIEGSGLTSDSSATGTLTTPVVQFYNGKVADEADVVPDAATPYSKVAVKVPVGTQTGPIVVRTSSQTGGINLAAGTPVFFAAPVITTFTPRTGPVGTRLVISGRNFQRNVTSVKMTPNVILSPYSITYGAFDAYGATTSITAIVPNSVILATGPITVTTPYGAGDSPVFFVPVGKLPTISDFTPKDGPAGTEVTITGTNFTPQMIGTSVTFNGVASLAAGFTYVSPTEIKATAPATVTTGPIRVVNDFGTSAPSEPDYAVTGPNLTSFAPTTGPVGTQVAIAGTNFTAQSNVYFSDATGNQTILATNFEYISNISLRVNVPTGAKAGPVRVNTLAGDSTSVLHYVPAGEVPIITDFDPKSGTGGAAGTVVTIIGENFTPQITNAMVSFNGVASHAATLTYVSPTEISVRPPATVTAGPIRVANAAGASIPSAQNFVPGIPTISVSLTASIVPTSAPVGALVTIAGTNFSPNSVVKFTNAAGTGTVNGANTRWVSTLVLWTFVPAGVGTGPITVSNEAGDSDPSVVHFVPAGAVPTIDDFTPKTGAAATEVTITGTNFTPQMLNTWVQFNGTASAAGGFVYDSPTQIRVKVPAGAITGPLRAANAAGASAPSAASFVLGVPTIAAAGLSPITGPVGTLVTITGTNFSPASVVKFTDGVGAQTLAAAAPMWVSNTVLRVRVPAGANTGKVAVTNEAGDSLASTQTFTVQTGAPVITGISPAYGAIGNTVTITGSGFTGATAVRFNANRTVISPSIDSDTQITAVVPASTITGPVTVVTAAGTGTSEKYFTIGTANTVSPTVTSFTPTIGSVGTTITIAGTNFTPTSVVKFSGASGDIDGTNITWVSAASIKADVPAGAVVGPIKVVNEVTSSAPSSTYFVPNGAVPTVTSITPASAPFGALVTINGTGFAPNSTVNFTASASALGTGTAQSVATAGNVFVSPTQIKVIVPAGTVIGPIKVNTVVTPGVGTLTLTSALSEQNFIPSGADPVVTTFTPTTGPVGTTVTIAGSNFTPNAVVKFSSATGVNLTATNFVWVSAASIRVDVPAGAVVGPISVTSDAGTSQLTPSYFIPSDSVPTITSIAPFNAPIGTLVKITGTNFAPNSTVQFTASTAAQATGAAQAINAAGNVFVSPTEIWVAVPAGTLVGPIKVNTPVTPAAGAAIILSSAISTQNFVPTGGVPLVTSISPASAPIGSAITILGANFTPDSVVRFSHSTGINRVATLVAWTNSTSIRVIVPALAITGPVTVTTTAGTSDPSVFHFTLPATNGIPTITSFTPTTGSGGTRVTVNGTNFTPQATISFNGVAGTDITYISPTQLSVNAPYNLSTGPIRVTTNAIAVSPTDFTALVGRPGVLSFTPNGAAAGATITIAGANFLGATSVNFTGAAAASFTVNSATSISAVVPAGAVSGPVTVTNATGVSASSATYFVPSTALPTITNFTPVSAPFGSIVTINGSNFTPQSSVQFSIAATPGGGVAQSITLAGNTFVSPTQIKVQVPAAATTGPIKVNNAAGASALSSVDFVPASSTPTITSFTNAVAEGDTVAIVGTNFSAESTVHFTGAGGAQDVASTITVNSTTSISATVPAGAKVGPIKVTNAAGSVLSGVTYFVPAGDVPTVTSFTPISGPIGTLLVINGTNFTPQSTVQFNNGTHTAQTLALVGNSFVSTTQIKVLVPAGATIGTLKVNNAAGASALSDDIFVAALLPTITAIAPNPAAAGDTVTLTGTNFTSVTKVFFTGAGGAQDVEATFTVNTAASISVEVPAGAQVGPIAVQNATGTVVSGPTLHFIPTGSVATVTGFTPNSGPIGTLVTINGTNFTPSSQVRFNNGAGVAQTLALAGNSFISSTQIQVLVPAATVTGGLTVSVSGAAIGVSAVSGDSFTVQPSP